jgi:alkylated DNA repair dioxygenase AlkB
MRPPPVLMPHGFHLKLDIINPEEERELLRRIGELTFHEVHMHGVVAKRRVLHYGWNYEYNSWRLTPGPLVPDFLVPLRQRTAEWLSLDPQDFSEVLLTEYTPGAAIGWHRDAPQFGIVAGVSLAGACRFRFRRGEAGSRETAEIELPPRSAYVLQGEARTAWQHHIPPAKELRYSVTFRTLRGKRTKNLVDGE